PTGAFLAGLIPWSRMSQPDLGLLLSIVGTAAAQFALALVPPWGRSWRGRVGALTRMNLLVISIDLATGSHLQANSLLGYNPLVISVHRSSASHLQPNSLLGYSPTVAGRYYGLGNQGAPIFIVSLFIFLGPAISRLRARARSRAVIAVPVLVGLLAVFVSGNP